MTHEMENLNSNSESVDSGVYTSSGARPCSGDANILSRRINLISTHLVPSIRYATRDGSRSHEIQRKSGVVQPEVDDMEDNFLPIFVCNCIFPGTAVRYLIFEPRYVLMVRNVLKTGSREFGVCMSLESFPDRYNCENELFNSDANKMGCCDYGCLVRLVKHQDLPDGRIVIYVNVISRFLITEVSTHSGRINGQLATYNTAKMKRIIDVFDKESDFIDDRLSKWAFKVLQKQFKELHSKFVSRFPHDVALNILMKVHGVEKFPGIFLHLKKAKEKDTILHRQPHSGGGSVNTRSAWAKEGPKRATVDVWNGDSLDSAKSQVSNAFEEACASLDAESYLDSDNRTASVWKALDALNLPEYIKYRFLSNTSMKKRLFFSLLIVQALVRMDITPEDSVDGKINLHVKANGSKSENIDPAGSPDRSSDGLFRVTFDEDTFID
uniref:Lon N-terminal domain-containing protein n=1 Tax=Aplanochytrium stocchinoi TaxID=215587 RepID=A0A7S3V126_9STRA|eukprot:CAMPEP_0204822816 /NCGR_PEP_ID=MMETSP1346-20131115/997_1 /ASSEMBLY_ACC=CAM_ASM_000771 /TAXON_ID=215587 /ORGANISM="Aplanochytrium stocchinoi, Strain GSBS06" /LENGTH=438 /DNA_ID=CAMNT_0051949235 /DNA_START=56 /DNA_END=1372 /DNA_ORIENTATION=-